MTNWEILVRASKALKFKALKTKVPAEQRDKIVEEEIAHFKTHLSSNSGKHWVDTKRLRRSIPGLEEAILVSEGANNRMLQDARKYMVELADVVELRQDVRAHLYLIYQGQKNIGWPDVNKAIAVQAMNALGI